MLQHWHQCIYSHTATIKGIDFSSLVKARALVIKTSTKHGSFARQSHASLSGSALVSTWARMHGGAYSEEMPRICYARSTTHLKSTCKGMLISQYPCEYSLQRKGRSICWQDPAAAKVAAILLPSKTCFLMFPGVSRLAQAIIPTYLCSFEIQKVPKSHSTGNFRFFRRFSSLPAIFLLLTSMQRQSSSEFLLPFKTVSIGICQITFRILRASQNGNIQH